LSNGICYVKQAKFHMLPLHVLVDLTCAKQVTVG